MESKGVAGAFFVRVDSKGVRGGREGQGARGQWKSERGKGPFDSSATADTLRVSILVGC